MDCWLDGRIYNNIYIYIYLNRWMVGRKDRNMKKNRWTIRWIEKKHLKKMMECWMDRKIYEKQMDG